MLRIPRTVSLPSTVLVIAGAVAAEEAHPRPQIEDGVCSARADCPTRRCVSMGVFRLAVPCYTFKLLAIAIEYAVFPIGGKSLA